MDQLSYIVNWIAKDVFGVPAYLVGIMTAVALIASRKGLGDIVGGALKATLGFIVLGIGAGAVIGALNPLGALITGAFGVAGVVPTNEAITAIVSNLPDVAQNVAFAMFLGVLLSLVIARLTPLRYVFLTVAEEEGLRAIARAGVTVTAQDVPSARAVSLEELLSANPDA